MLARNEWEDLLRAKLRLKPGVTLYVEKVIREGEVAPAGLACDWTNGKTYTLAPWHSHFLRMVEEGSELEETIRVVIGLFPDAACRERIREFVGWLELKDLAVLERSNSLRRRSSARKNVFVTSPRGAAPEKGVLQLSADGSRPGIGDTVAGKESRGSGAKSLSKLEWAAAAAVLLVFAGAYYLRVSPGESLGSDSEVVTAKQVAPKLAETIPIRAAAPGILTEVLVRDGDRIARGDVVARIQNAEALKTLDELRRDLGEHRMRRDEYYRTGNWNAYVAVVRKIVHDSHRIGELEAASRPIELLSPVSGQVEADTAIGRNVGNEIGGGELILNIRSEE